MFPSSSDDEFDRNHQNNPRRRRRIFRERINTEFESIVQFNERFRMSHENLELLLNDIGHFLRRATNRSMALSEKMQLCAALHWLGTGTHYHAVGDMHGISKASVYRAVHKVVEAVVRIKFPQVVTWPENVVDVVERFHMIAGFPQVIGCVDGTLIKIDAPTQNELNYVDRHGNHSLNCMVVCGPDLSFYYVSARWPGSVNDVLRNSSLYRRMEEGWRPVPGAVILGDSIYPLNQPKQPAF